MSRKKNKPDKKNNDCFNYSYIEDIFKECRTDVVAIDKDLFYTINNISRGYHYIKQTENTYNLTEIDTENIDYIMGRIDNHVEKDEAIDFIIQVIHTYECLGKDECLKSFDTFANKIINTGNLFFPEYIVKLGDFITFLLIINIIDEDEMRALVERYSKAILDKEERNAERYREEIEKIKKNQKKPE